MNDIKKSIKLLVANNPVNNQLINIITDKNKCIEELKTKYENNSKNDIIMVDELLPGQLILNNIAIISRSNDNFINVKQVINNLIIGILLNQLNN